MSELQKLFRQAVTKAIQGEGIPGTLGRGDGTIYYTEPDGSIARDKVWATIGGSTELVVYSGSAPRQYGLPVRIGERDGRPTVLRTDPARLTEFTGGRPMEIPEHAWTHGRFGPDALYITGPAFLPLMAHPTDPLAMTVTVEQGFYRYSSVESVFQTTTSSSLSSYVPTAPNGQYFIVLCLNRSTNALAIVGGSSSVAPSTTNPFTPGTVLAVVSTLADTHYPLAAIRFYTGQTQITAQDIFMDLRLWGGEVGTIAFNDAEGDPANVAAAAADGTSNYPARRDHVHTIAVDIVTNAMLRNSGALSVIGRSANSTGDPADISATAASDAVLRESGSVLGFGTVATGGIANSAVTYAKIQNVSATDKILGRATAGAGVVEEITLTAFGRSLIDDAAASNARTTLGLGTIATEAETNYLLVDGTRAMTGVLTLVNANLVLDNALPGMRGDGSLAIRIDADNTQTNRTLVIQHDAGTELARIGEDGFMGIGITSPDSTLHVADTFKLEGASPTNRMRESDQTLPAGLWQYRLQGDIFRIEQNTAAGGDFSTSDSKLQIQADGDTLLCPAAGSVTVGISTNPAISDGIGIDVNGKILRLRTSKTPASAAATGNAGEICWDSGFLYVCTATNTWKRVAIATW